MDQERLLKRAEHLAEELVAREVDINELKKLVSYFACYRDKQRLLALLEARWEEARRYQYQIDSGTKRWKAFGLFIRSSTTYDHIRGLYEAVPPAISDLNVEQVGYLLGWASRLATAYKEAPNLAAVEQFDQQTRPALRPTRAPKPRPAAEGDRRTGKVKWFNVEMGYGFIDMDSGGDVFVHLSETPDKQGLRGGQRVSFAKEMGPKGPRACDVRPE